MRCDVSAAVGGRARYGAPPLAVNYLPLVRAAWGVVDRASGGGFRAACTNVPYLRS